MNHDQEEFARKITAYLDQGTAGLRAGTAYRLQQARAKALARLAEEPARATESRMAHALVGGGSGERGMRRGAWLGLGILVLVAAVYGFQQWQLYQQTREIEELDVQILTSDLPIDAYVDRGFQTWLTSYQR